MTLRSRLGLGVATLLVFAASVTGLVHAVAGLDGPADRPVETAWRVEAPRPAVVIGDSAIAALRWVPGADNALVGFDHTLDLESCRRLYETSCHGREQRQPPSVVEALDFHADKYDVLIVATGYNDSVGAFVESFEQVVAAARRFGYSQIVWYTLRSQVDYVSPGSVANHETFRVNNAQLTELLGTGKYPEVVLADWDTYTDGLTDWFVTDGVHYRQLGAWGASDYLTRKMAFLEGRPCPIPVAPGDMVQDPCPDPDATGPIADIAALYPIGEDGVLCYEIGEQRRTECRVDTHVIQILRILQTGDTGDDVRALQTRLQRLGLLGEVSGSFESATAEAVAAFQRQQDLPVTGIADVDTLEALGFDTAGITS